MPPQPEPLRPRSAAHPPSADDRHTPVRAVDSEALFDGAQELHIEHRGTLYRLRRTSLGKLILTK